MSVEKSVVWNWEDPINITANLTTTIKWQPNTFGGSATNNFSCNIWMMRQDSSSDSQVFVWAPVLLAANQNVFNNSIFWTPTMDDVDFDVTQLGSNQLAWESSSADASLTWAAHNLRGYSKGFKVHAPEDVNSTTPSVLTQTSSSTSIPTSSSTTTSAGEEQITSPPHDTSSSSNSGVSIPAAIGLGIGLGMLLICIAGTIMFIRYLRKQTRVQIQSFPMKPASIQSSQDCGKQALELPSWYPPPPVPPVEMRGWRDGREGRHEFGS